MSVIIELSIPAREFALGRLLQMERGTRIVIETTVPLGDKSLPFIRVFDEHERFEGGVSKHDAVNDIHVVSTNGHEILYALDWDVSQDDFFNGVKQCDGTLLDSTGSKDTWNFKIRFETHGALGDFRDYCQRNDIPVELDRLYNPTNPDAGPRYGLTIPQRDALNKAVESGYYRIPRQISTKALAAEFDVTDQAMSERLRRGIENLVSNTIHVPAEQITN